MLDDPNGCVHDVLCRSDRRCFRRSLPLLPASARDEIAKLIQPQTLAMVAGVLTAWVISHFFGVGEIVDAILIGAGVLAIGLSVFEGIDELYEFAKGALGAKNFEDLDASARHLARAVSILGVLPAQERRRRLRELLGSAGGIVPGSSAKRGHGKGRPAHDFRD